jgi:hypothetical protein
MPEKNPMEQINSSEIAIDNQLVIFQLSLNKVGGILDEIKIMKAKAETKEEKDKIDKMMSEQLKTAVGSVNEELNKYLEACA